MIRIEGLSVAFGRTLALDGLDLELEPGVIGVFGPNGSGKSTLLRVVAGLVAPTRGSVSRDGLRITLGDEQLRRLVGYAGHEAGLYGRLTVAENLALFATLYGAGEASAGIVADQLGLDAVRATPVHALSAGLKRRAAVARALVHSPTLLLLDEPYANLDDEAAELVSTAVRQWREPGRTALIATHGAKKVKGWADAGVVLQRGRLSAFGRYAEHGRFAGRVGR